MDIYIKNIYIKKCIYEKTNIKKNVYIKKYILKRI